MAEENLAFILTPCVWNENNPNTPRNHYSAGKREVAALPWILFMDPRDIIAIHRVSGKIMEDLQMFPLFPHRILAVGLVSLLCGPLAAQSLEIQVEPRSAPASGSFLIVLTNVGAEDILYSDCCTLPRIVSADTGEDAFCPNCPKKPCFPDDTVLPAGGTLEFEWRPAESPCGDIAPLPGIYQVSWSQFPEQTVDRLEILPEPDRTIEVTAEPTEVRFGETVRLVARNTSEFTILYSACCGGPSILGPSGRSVFCPDCTICPMVEPMEVPPGESVAFDWIAGGDPCPETWVIPGRHRIVWSFPAQAEPATSFVGETTVLVLPREDRALRLDLSRAEARPGEAIAVTATNEMDVPVLRLGMVGCLDMILLDPLGLEGSCMRCSLAGDDEEIPPGGTMSRDIVIPESGFCGAVHPGRWSLIWGRYFRIASGPGEGEPVYGHVEIEVLSDEVTFIRGDCDPSGDLDLTDAISLLQHLFLGGSAPACPDACDSDDSGELDLTDSIAILSFLFLGGARPPAPYPVAGEDPSIDALGCEG
jgi:hypothetical protein